MNFDIDYTYYELVDLNEALSTIDRDLYPERYQLLLLEIKKRQSGVPAKSKNKESLKEKVFREATERNVEKERANEKYHLIPIPSASFIDVLATFGLTNFFVKKRGKIEANVQKDTDNYKIFVTNSDSFENETFKPQYLTKKSGFFKPIYQLIHHDEVIAYITRDKFFSLKLFLNYNNKKYLLSNVGRFGDLDIMSDSKTLVSLRRNHSSSVKGYFLDENSFPIHIKIFLMCHTQFEPSH
jgi:hypothetical protein